MRVPGKWWALPALLPLLAWGGVKASVEENPILKGESVELAVEAEGERVRFPHIEKIGPYRVTEEGSQRMERMESNRTVVRWVKLYAFTPERSVTVPPLTVEVDGKAERTRPLSIRVERTPKRHVESFALDLNASKTTAYVGEPIDVTLRFRERREIPVMNVDFLPMRNDDFWIKRVHGRKEYARGGYLVHEVHYLYFPQCPGELAIGPAEVKVAVTKKVRDAFGFIVRRPEWIRVKSEPVTVRVKPLPQGVQLVGRFTMEADAAPRKVRSGEPVTLEVTVEAEGNIEDFSLPPLKIEGVTAYADPPKVEQRFTRGVYRGSWRRRYVLISDRSYTIPSLSLRYLDPKSGQVEEVHTPPIAIEVERGAAAPAKERGKERIEEKRVESPMEWMAALAAAFVAGMGFMYLLSRLAKRKKRRARRARSDETRAEMLQRLMPYIAESKEAAQMAENLYASLFEDRTVRIDKRAYRSLMERLESGRRKKSL